MRDKNRLPEEALLDSGGLPDSLLPEGGKVGPLRSESDYHNTLQGTPIHGLIASSTAEQAYQMNAITHTGTAKSEGIIITVDEDVIGNLSPQTFKGLIMLLTVATEQLPRENQITAEAILSKREITITLEDYMKACKVRDKKSAREQLNTIIRTIYGISLEWDETEWNRPEGKSRKVKERMHYTARIVDKIGVSAGENPVKGGKVKVTLTADMASYLAGAYIMPYPSALLTINTQYHPYSIPLGWKLCALYNMNYENPERRSRTTVATLMRAAKGIPRYEAISSTGQVYNRIIAPFDRDMQELVSAGVLSSYYYETPLGERIEGNKLGGLSYQEFSALYVRFELRGYPDQTPRIEAKQKRISAAISRAKKAAKKKETETGAPS